MEFWTVWHCLLCTLNQLTISHARSGSYSESPQSVLSNAVPLLMKVPKAKMNDLLSATYVQSFDRIHFVIRIFCVAEIQKEVYTIIGIQNWTGELSKQYTKCSLQKTPLL